MVVWAVTRREKDIECFYELLKRLEERVGGPYLLKDFMSVVPPTTKGVYFIFESGEVRSHQPDRPRVVRVGTHGLTARSRSTIWTRLFEHLMANGRSVFRNDINHALRKRGGHDDSLNHSARITRYIGRMPFLWVEVDGEDGHEKRKYIERNAIALLSGRRETTPDKHSESWLGLCSEKPAIRKSGLWNVNHTNSEYCHAFLTDLERCIEQTYSFDNQGTALDVPACPKR